jgi:metallo-beta-lactamase class B
MPLALIGALSLAATLAAQSSDSADSYVAKAKAIAATEQTALIDLCTPSAAAAATTSSTPNTAPKPQAPPARSSYAREPMKVFDNLYYVGEQNYSAWAVTTSAGIIIIDTIYDYSVQDQIVGGLKKLGLDPATIKYAVVSHAHRDHVGGAAYLQKAFGARVLMTAADWDLLARSNESYPKPKRDIDVTNGQQLTLGETTLTFIHTPGHTPGTMSTLVPLKDHGTPHVGALWGGTGFNFTITPDLPAAYWFDAYVTSAQRFRDAAKKAGADVFLSNHPNWDGSTAKMPALEKRAAGAPHPYVIGASSVQNYLTIAELCARAGRARLQKM